MIPIDEALQLIEDRVGLAPTEQVALANTTGRVLAQPVLTDIDSPPHSKSVMDGFAVIAADVASGRVLDVVETVPAGAVPTRKVETGQATRIMTGAPIPEGADAVVMIECTEFDEAGRRVTIQLDSLTAGQHVMEKASAMKCGDEVFPVGHRVRPQDVGLLAESGAANVEAFQQPSIAVLPTGDELVEYDQFPGPGMIRNSNGPMLVSLASQQTDKVLDLGVGLDDREALRAKVIEGLKNDFLILSGGVSAGMLDLVPEILAEQGVDQVFHQVRVKPGKPIWFGVHQSDTGARFVFGLPGNPVSSLVGFNLFVRAALERRVGRDIWQPERHGIADLTEFHEVRGNRTTYWPVRTFWSDGRMMAEPIVWRGSSDMRALGQANGLAILEPDSGSQFDAGSSIRVLHLNS